ncbi:MAG: PAS domain S-box protein, partial [Nitrospiraceae bacterium]|nr:PAS domain S-box protein [Nitrospiraceae bacterium]
MNDSCKILVVDDDAGYSGMLNRQLSRLGYPCAAADGGAAGLQALMADDFDVAFIDLVMPDMDGIALLRAMGETDLDTVPVVLSGRGTISTAVEAMKCGAFDYMEKEPGIEILRSTVERAASHRRVKRQARQMSKTARQWEATFDAVPDLMAIIDTEHRFVRVNRAMAEKLGCSVEKAVGLTCHECVHGLDEPIEGCPHAQLLKDNLEHMATIAEERLGEHFHVTTSPLYDAQGGLIGSVHVARDITQQKAAEEELRKAHMETEGLVFSMSSLLIEVDTELAVRRWNPAAEKTFGISAQEVLGKPFADSGIRLDWDWVSEELPGWLTSGEPVRLPEFRYERPDGVEGVLGLTVNPIRNDDRESMGFFLMGADITERKVLEAQLVQAQKLESIGQLAAGIAHEINTPTQYVGDNIEFLQCAFEQLEELRTAYDKLLESAKAGTLQDSELAEIAAAIEEANVEYLVEQIP